MSLVDEISKQASISSGLTSFCFRKKLFDESVCRAVLFLSRMRLATSAPRDDSMRVPPESYLIVGVDLSLLSHS